MNRKTNLNLLILMMCSFFGMAQINPNFNPLPASYGVNSPNPTYALDIVYDDLDTEKQVIHLFLPDTEGSFPLVAHIHGGGFISGSPNTILSGASNQLEIKQCLENGIAFASIGYRLIATNGPDNEGVIKCLNDAKRALQFVRHYANDLNIDPEKIALKGNSAGASTSLWLATRSDMADPNSPDPILSESTRVCAAGMSGPQATLDTYKWETQVFSNFDGQGTNFTLADMENILGFDRGSNFYGGLDSTLQILYDPALIQYREDVDMLFHMSSDDPPLYIRSSSSAVHPSEDLFHHSFHGREINDAAIAANVSEVKADIPALSINTTDGESVIDFLIRHLNSCSLIRCDAPTNISCAAYSGNVARATWTASPDAARYRLRYRPVGGSWTELLTARDETFRYINGLTPNTDYEYQLKSLCASDNSPWSSTYTFTSLGSICDLTTINNHTASLNDATLYWSADADDVKYRVKYRPKGSAGSWVQLDNITNTQLSISALNANTEYKVKIKVKCEAGWTQWQSNYDFITAAANLSFNQDFKNKSISLYPNPAQDFLNLEINEGALEQVQIQNINGRIYQSLFTSEKKLAVDVLRFPKGIYFVELTFVDGTAVVRKFIKN